MRDDSGGRWRTAGQDEAGEAAILRPYPYMALTVWNSKGFGSAGWQGDVERWASYFTQDGAYIQGDLAIRHGDGSYTFHGRSDEVINVGGTRIGTEEIENALLDQDSEESPVKDVCVVGLPHPTMGTVPCAFVVSKSGASLARHEAARLQRQVKSRLGAHAVPAEFVVVPTLPQTHSGKYSRQTLRSIFGGETLGYQGALKNPECLPAIKAIAHAHKAQSEVHGGNERVADLTHVRLAVSDSEDSATEALAQGFRDDGDETVTQAILDAVHRVTGRDDVRPDTPLMTAGIDSFDAINLAQELEETFDASLSSTIAFEYGTVRAMSPYVRSASGSRSSSPCLLSRRNSRTSLDREISPSRRASLLAESRLVPNINMLPLHFRLEEAAIHAYVACLPNGADQLSKVNSSLACGADLVSEIPFSRWTLDDSATFGDAIAKRLRNAAFLRGVDLFDNENFGISEAEAAAMDPQQRLLLEKGHAALQASQHLDELEKEIGVFVAIAAISNDFANLLKESPTATSVYAATGGSHSIASGRISFALGLTGACVSYDTACSANLVACHAAMCAHSLRECAAALATGVFVMLAPGTSNAFAVAGMLSTLGRCHTFDSRADGYARGEACSAIVMSSRGGDADVILGLEGSSVRQDGRSASLTAPNGQAQIMMLTAALTAAGLRRDHGHTTSWEAHGTGTALGDPIEVRSLLAAAWADVSENAFAIRGVKANCGHGEPAAGGSGLIGLLEGLRQCTTPPNAQLHVLNTHVKSALTAHRALFPMHATAHTDFVGGSGVDYAGVSSFGYSGTIACVVVGVGSGSKAASPEVNSHAAELRPKRRRFEVRKVPHPLCAVCESSEQGVLSRCVIDAALMAVVSDHIVAGRVLFPVAGYLELGRACATNFLGGGRGPRVTLECLSFLQPLVLDGRCSFVECNVDGQSSSLEVTSVHLEGSRTTHCAGSMRPSGAVEASLDLASIFEVCSRPFSPAKVYEWLRSAHLEYGEEYRRLEMICAPFASSDIALGRLRRRHWLAGTLVHPADLEGALQMIHILAGDGGEQPRMPFAVGNATLDRCIGLVWAAVAANGNASSTVSYTHLTLPTKRIV